MIAMRNMWTDMMVQGSLWALGVSVALIAAGQLAAWIRWSL